MRNLKIAIVVLATLMFCKLGIARGETISVNISPNAAPRVEFGAERLAIALKDVGFESNVTRDRQVVGSDRTIAVTTDGTIGREGFTFTTRTDGLIEIAGGDASGALYGCLELANRIRQTHKWPRDLSYSDKPVFRLRGSCIGMQKTSILPGRKIYEYPYTPELFPFFYDKQHWREFLDFLVENRMNTLLSPRKTLSWGNCATKGGEVRSLSPCSIGTQRLNQAFLTRWWGTSGEH